MKNTCSEIQFYYCNWFHQVAIFSKLIHKYFSKILKKYLFLKYLPRTVPNSRVINSRQVQNCWKMNNRHTFSNILRKLLSRATLVTWPWLRFCNNPTKTTLEITDRNIVTNRSQQNHEKSLKTLKNRKDRPKWDE